MAESLLRVELALTAEQAGLLLEMVDGAADVFADMEEHDEVDVRLVAGLVRNAVKAAKGGDPMTRQGLEQGKRTPPGSLVE